VVIAQLDRLIILISQSKIGRRFPEQGRGAARSKQEG